MSDLTVLQGLMLEMAPAYHELAIEAEDEPLHPAVTWERCPDDLCARARLLVGKEPGWGALAYTYVHDAPCPLSGTEHTHEVFDVG